MSCFTGIEFCKSRERRAKKVHECMECGEKIMPGFLYHYKVGVAWDESMSDTYFWTSKICAQCEADWEILTDAEIDAIGSANEGMVYGNLGKRIDEAYENGWLRKDNTANTKMYKRWRKILCQKDWRKSSTV